MKQVTHLETKVKTILNSSEVPDTWFWVSYNVNPYRGCQHDCTYCDGKAEYYRIDNFSSVIKIKINSPEILRKELLAKGFYPVLSSKKTLLDYVQVPTEEKKDFIEQKDIKPRHVISVGGGVCDVYQPAERKYQVVRKLLKICHEFNFPVMVLTKSDLVLRDLDLLQEINQQTRATVSFSITLVDDQHRRIFEPHSSSTPARFAALKKVREAGLHGGVMFMPVIPLIGDTIENMESIIRMSKEAGAEFVQISSMTLKQGRNREEFFSILEHHFPELIKDYKKIYARAGVYGHPDLTGYPNPSKIGLEICKKYNMPDRMNRYVPLGTFEKNLKASELLGNLYYYKSFCRIKAVKKVKSRQLRDAHRYLELIEEDISRKSLEEIKKIKELDPVANLLYEYFQTGKTVLDT
ncbi:MAG: radical SAM protein [Candidatus Hodarchaeales archaeon]|jgi:DNA repair photolyase